MPLSWTHQLVKTTSVDVFTFKNTTVYGGSNPNRNASAEVLIAAHVNEGIENFVTVDSTPYLTKIDYSINNTIDGHYHFEILRFPKWTSSPYTQVEVTDGDGNITTYAALVYGETTNKFYKLISASTNVEPGVAVSWEDDWEEIVDFTDEDIRLNDTIEVAVFDDLYDGRSTICIKNDLYKLSCGDPNCIDLNSMKNYLKKVVLLAGARSKNEDNQPEKAEKIIRTLENMCGKC